ncbi:MAG TPA: hypothetical protein VN580_11990 [Clostridia bacterium]|nr:hypothetical protein [Clostridia bacterium]
MLINAFITPVKCGISGIVALLGAKDNKESLAGILFAILYLFPFPLAHCGSDRNKGDISVKYPDRRLCI